jgi:hypothetical protein
MKSILILPCGVADYDKVTPEFLEIDVTNKIPKVFLSIHQWNLSNVAEIVLILFNNKFIEEQKQQLNEFINHEYGSKHGIKIITIEPTQSVVETVYQYTKDIDDCSIYIKDFDDKFSLTKGLYPNTVYINSLNNGGITDVEKKSYVQIDSINTILNIVEKDVISSYFCVGLYSFKSSDYFNQTVKKLQNCGLTNLFISHIIYDMILNGTRFTSQMTEDYLDWGSDKLWQSYINSQHQTINNSRKNRLYTFGCSHSTWYSLTSDVPKTESWGEVLANKLEIEHWDIARPNSGIDEIFNSFVELVINKEITKDDIVIFNASYPGRLRLPFLKINSEDGRDDVESDGFGILRTPDFHNSEFYEKMKSYGIKIDADKQFLRWVNLQEFVYSVLEYIGCTYYSWQLEDVGFLHTWYRKLILEKKVITYIENPLTKNIINPPDEYESWYDWNRDNSWPDDDSHLSHKGHYLFANYLYKKIKDDKL